MLNPNIRIVRQDEVKTLQNLSVRTFTDSFAEFNTVSDMQLYLEKNLSLEKLKTELANPESLFFFAELDGEIIGYLKINFGLAQTDVNQPNSLEIERIYVLKQFHGKKIADVLLNTAITIAKEKHSDFIWLGVWEKNPRAIAFYLKNGFVIFNQHKFLLGHDLQTDLLMRMDLHQPK